jgi:selenium metabolism protein YedF
VLVRGFFHTLGEVAPRPDVILFFNAGVWLTIDDSPVLEDLRALAGAGVEILACGTCLAHFGITDRLGVGVVSNMYDIAETMLGAGRVVQL